MSHSAVARPRKLLDLPFFFATFYNHDCVYRALHELQLYYEAGGAATMCNFFKTKSITKDAWMCKQ